MEIKKEATTGCRCLFKSLWELEQCGFGSHRIGGATTLERAWVRTGEGSRWEVRVFKVLRQHAMGVEEAAVDGEAVLLHGGPGVGIGVHRGDGLFELFVEAGGFGSFVFAVFDGPAGGVLRASFNPPAIEDRKRRD